MGALSSVTKHFKKVPTNCVIVQYNLIITHSVVTNVPLDITYYRLQRTHFLVPQDKFPRLQRTFYIFWLSLFGSVI